MVCCYQRCLRLDPLVVQVFQFGFRSSRKFQKKLFIWDLLERVHERLASEVTVGEGEEGRREAADHSVQSFLDAITRISSSNLCIGKDEKVGQCWSYSCRFAGIPLYS